MLCVADAVFIVIMIVARVSTIYLRRQFRSTTTWKVSKRKRSKSEILERGYNDIMTWVMACLSNRTVWVCAVISIGVEARVQLVSSVSTVRTVVGRCSVSCVQALAVSVSWYDACSVTCSVVAVLDLIGTTGGNCCVLVDTLTVPASLVYGSVEVSADGFASSPCCVSTLRGRKVSFGALHEPCQLPS